MQELGTLDGCYDSAATDINNAGEIVGFCESGRREYDAFVWDATHGMRKLEGLGGPRARAHSINDAGQDRKGGG